MTDDDDARRVLGVSADTDRTEIRAAFRRQVRLSHPDVSGDDSPDNLDAVRELLEAYRTLGAADSSAQARPSAGFAFVGLHASRGLAPSARPLRMILVAMILLASIGLVLFFLIAFSQSGR